jgi:hypothetical protein
VSDNETLGTFFDYLWDAEEGFAYIAYKVSGNQYSFKQEFFQWPAQRELLIEFVLEKRAKYEVYHAPSLFKDASSADKNNVRGANVVWCEFDGNSPSTMAEPSSNAGVAQANNQIPRPTLRIQSSLEGHEHWYWKLDQFVDSEQLDRINRSITYSLGADTSGWDANQILRPPSTFNHKRDRPVVVLEHFTGRLDLRLFEGLPPPPPLVTIPLPDKLPAIEEVVFGHKFPEHVFRLFKVGAPIGKRSATMMSLGYYLAELQLTDNEILAMLLNADKRWGKFDGRQDQLVRLAEIVTIARQKYPYTGTSDDMVPKLQPMGLLTLLRTEVHVEWVWKGILQTKGYMCLTGPSGIGKTQLALDVAGQIALGKPALDRETTPMKIGFFSLEMNLVELKEFLVLMAASFTPEEQEILEENFQFFPLGEPLYLNRGEEQEQVEQAIKDHGLQGIIIDSLGSATNSSLSDQLATKPLLDWNDRLRQRMGVFTWFIHHHRKASGDNKKPKKLDDVYGDMYIVGRASSAIALWESGIPNTLDFIPLKIRLTKNPGKFHIKRGADLHFTRMVGGVVTEESNSEEDDEKEELESVELIIPDGLSI